MQYLIGVDDTDNLESRGTGYRARCMGLKIQETGIATLKHVVRHQLLVDPQIPYTSHNSSVCLVVETKQDGFESLVNLCEAYLCEESAPGSDAGLCIAPLEAIKETLQTFGQSAKEKVLLRKDALALAQQEEVFLKGLTGDKNGIIGALAAIGLQAGGNDGRFIWAKGVRELSGVYSAAALYDTTGIDIIQSINQMPVQDSARINVDPWPRPVLINRQAVLLVEPAPESQDYEWQVLPKAVIKKY